MRGGGCVDRAAGRQYVDGRRCHAIGGWQRIRAEPVPHDARPRHRPDRPDLDHRSRRHIEGSPELRRRCGMPVASVDLVGRHRTDRRHPRHQRRWQQHRALRQCARPRTWSRGGPAGRVGVERSTPAAQGQHRLLPAPTLRWLGGHAWHHHRRGAQTRAAAARDLRRVLRGSLSRGSAGSVQPLPGARSRGCASLRSTCPAQGSTSC